NFLPASVDADEEHVIVAGRHRVASLRAGGNAGRAVVAGIRPEHLRPASAADGERRIPIRVELVEALGADTLIHGALEGGGEPILARLPGVPTLAAGDQTGLAVEADQLHLFDEGSGRAVGAPR